jgi:anaerobic selenocysteine-containing dehydrogenase
MNEERRDFLKQSGLAGAMAIAGAGTFQSTAAGAATAGGGGGRTAP